MKILTNILKFFIKSIAWLGCWALLGWMTNHFIQRNYTIKPDEFMVCVIDKDRTLESDGSIGNIAFPMVYNVTYQEPCNEPTPDREIFYKLDWIVKRIDDDEWEVHFYNGYFWSDPFIYHYRVDYGRNPAKIIPMWHSYTELGRLFWAVFIAFILNVILFSWLLGGLRLAKNHFFTHNT